MPKKLRPTFTQAQKVTLHKTARSVFETKFAARGKQAAMAKALGLSQTSVSALLRGTYHPGEAVAAELAILAGYDDLRDLVGPYHQPEAEESAPASTRRSPFPNLKKCVDFHPDKWPVWVIAAAEAGFFPEDVAPAAWVPRLDTLESSMRKHK